MEIAFSISVPIVNMIQLSFETHQKEILIRR